MQRNLLKNNKKVIDWIGAVLIPTIIFGIIAVYNGFVYGINDDTGMRSMAMGAYGAGPDAHLTWQSYLFGLIVSTMYKIIPMCDWYGIILWGFTLISICLLLWSYGKNASTVRSKSIIYGISIIVISILLGSDFLALQWTTASGICGVCGCIIYFISDKERGDKCYSYILCLIFSFLLRQYSFYMICILLGLLFVYKNIREVNCKELKKTFARVLEDNKSFFIIVLLFLLSMMIDKFTYSSEEWAEYQDYTYQRALIYDYLGVPSWKNASEFYIDNGFTEETVEMLQHYQIGFLDDVKTQELQKIVSYAQETRAVEEKSLWNILVNEYTRISHNQYRNIIILLIIITAVSLVAKIKHKSWLDAIYISISLIGYVIIDLYLSNAGKMPDRVLFILLLMYLTNLLSIWWEDIKKISACKIGKKESILIGLCAFFTFNLLVSCFAKGYENVAKVKEANNYQAVEYDYFKRNNDKWFITIDGAGLGSTGNFTFPQCSFQPNNTIETVGWGIQNPLWKDKLELMDVETIIEAMFKDNVYVCTHSTDKFQVILSYLHSQGIEYTAQLVDEIVVFEDKCVMYVYKVNGKEK